MASVRPIDATLTALTWALRRRPNSRVLASASFRFAARTGGTRVGRLFTGHRMLLDLSEFAQRHIFMFGTYEEAATRHLVSRAQPGWTFLDVGACEGYYSVLAVALGGPGSQVVAIEPDPRALEQLRGTVSIGGYSIEVLGIGCGSSSGTLRLTMSDVVGNRGMSSFVRTDRGQETIEVEIATLDSICMERGLRPDVVKIDVEGFETEVIEGFRHTLTDAPPDLLLVELAPRSPRHAHARHLLESFGYKARRLLESGEGVPLESEDELANVQLVAFSRNRRASTDKS